jgi:hypothetical protein
VYTSANTKLYYRVSESHRPGIIEICHACKRYPSHFSDSRHSTPSDLSAIGGEVTATHLCGGGGRWGSSSSCCQGWWSIASTIGLFKLCMQIDALMIRARIVSYYGLRLRDVVHGRSERSDGYGVYNCAPECQFAEGSERIASEMACHTYEPVGPADPSVVRTIRSFAARASATTATQL